MFRPRSVFVFHPRPYAAYFVFAFALSLVACSGGSGGTGSTSGGGGGGGTSSNPPTSGEYLWETGSTSNLTYATIDAATGALGAPTVAGGPASNPTNYPSILAAPSGNYLYAFWASFSMLETFKMSGPGLQLQNMTDSGYTLSAPYAWSMTMHPSGKFFYLVSSGTQGSIQEVSVDTSKGSMTLGPVVKENADLRVAVIDPAGQFLFINDLTGGRIFVYQINQTTGALSAVPNSPFTLPSNEQPAQLAIGGSGASLFLYAALYTQNWNNGGIAALAVNSSTGGLTPVSGSPFQTGGEAPSYICIDPSRKFLYATSAQDGSLFGLSINPLTGELSSVTGSPFATAATSGTISLDPSGKFLYVTNYSASKIYGFSLNSATGALSPIAGSPFAAVAQPEGLTMMSIP